MLQNVWELGDTVNVKREQGNGTKVKISLTLNQVPLPPRPPPPDAKYEHSVISVMEKRNGLALGLMGFDAYLDISGGRADILKSELDPSLSLQALLEGMVAYWFDIKIIIL